MCDTVVATGSVTADGVTLFGKNSDREPNEAQYVVHFPAGNHAPESKLRCTYLTIPQAARTHAVLLSKPFWMWGAEMGVNEHGLAIGNEAVFTRVPYRRGKGLTGMDLLRLGLERAGTAREAVDVITALLENHGQGGNCGCDHRLYYHNSFLLADPREAWLLETADRHWAARRIEGGYAISNRLTIENDWDLASGELVDFAVRRGWCRSRADFSFARCYSDYLYTTFSASRHRRARTTALLDARRGELSPADFMAILRDHGADDEKGWRPDRGLFQSQVCNHAGWGPVRVSQTTGSLVSHLSPGAATHFLTGTAAPCTGIFKPLWVDTPGAWTDAPPTASFDPESLFWQHERLHRTIIEDYPRRMNAYAAARDGLEAAIRTEALSAAHRGRGDRHRTARDFYLQAQTAAQEWNRAVRAGSGKGRSGLLFDLAWRRRNRRAGMVF